MAIRSLKLRFITLLAVGISGHFAALRLFCGLHYWLFYGHIFD